MSALESRERDLEYLWEVHKYLTEMSKFADAKIAFVTAVSGGILGFLLSKNLPDKILAGPFAQSLSIMFGMFAVLCLAFSIGCALVGFLPRAWWTHSGRSKEVGLIFWEAIMAHQSSDAFSTYFESSTPEVKSRHLQEQIYTVSMVVEKKFLFCKLATIFALIGAAAVLIHVPMTVEPPSKSSVSTVMKCIPSE